MAETSGVCGRAEGDTGDGFDPLGPMTTCELCSRRACPVCYADSDCCFADAGDHDDDPVWAPRGWRRAGEGLGGVAFERVTLAGRPDSD